MVGKKFNRWTIIAKADPYIWRGKNFTRWNVTCDCGRKSIIRECALKSGTSKSCRNCGNLTHGHSQNKKQTGIYQSWRDMIKRCKNPKIKQYHNYGGRGIKVCDRWLKFENFLEDMGSTWSKGLTIDRIDTNGNYEINNCRWITRQEQFKTRTNRISSFSKKDVLKIKKYKQNGIQSEHIAKLFNISRAYVYDIVNGKLDYLL